MLDLSHIEFAPAPLSTQRGIVCPRGARPPIPPSPSRRAADPETWALLASVFNGFSLDVQAYRPAALERRLPALQRRLRVKSVTDARPTLLQSPHLRSAALECLLLGVTDFFRDPPVFEYLRRVALPELLSARSGIRVLSAGSSDGRELYSLAILLADANALHRSTLCGIDCRPDAIAQARAASFAPDAIARLDPSLCARWFVPAGSGFRLRAEIAGAARFQVADLFNFAVSQPWDIILCRNVIMYFEPPAARRAWEHLAGHLSPGGLLVSGKAEQPPSDLPLTRIASCLYHRLIPSAEAIAFP